MSDTKLFENDEEFVLKSGSTPRVAVEKKLDGLRLELFYSEGKIRIFTDSGNWVEDSLPDLVEEVKNIEHPVPSFCWGGELELWIDGKHRPREEIAALLHKKEKISGKTITFSVFDCLYSDKDLHKLTLRERREKLEEFTFPQCTMGVPGEDVILNLLPSEYCETLKEVENAIRKCLQAPGSEGAMIKLTDWKSSDYPLSGMTSSWIKQKKHASIHCLVGKVNKTKVGPDTFNYELYLRFRSSDNVDPGTVENIGGQEYVHCGRSYNSNIKAEVGEILTISFHSMNLYDGEDESKAVYRLHLYEPVVREKFVDETTPDFFSTAIKVGEDSGLLIEKELTKAMDLLWRVSPEEMKNFVPDYRRSDSHDQGVLKMETVPVELRKGRFVWFVTDDSREDFGKIDRELEVENMKNPKKGRKVGRTTLTSKRATDLEEGEGTYPRTSGRYRGVAIGRDKDGFFVFTHRTRSKSYPSLDKIPEKVITWIASTG